ncbi:MAG TPA: hypothetical protein VHD87_14240 [Acidimicrobiales bacterium]|nr:hypothetical protein [Acidimicrobiales bacterium]
MALAQNSQHPAFRKPVAPLGAHVRLLVLAPGDGEAACVDLDTGGLVWATWDPESSNVVPIRLRQMDVLSARTVANPAEPDPSRPETIELEHPPVAIGRLRGRRAQKLLTPLHHPEKNELLGFAGEAVPYWTLQGDRPSMTIVNPHGDIVLTATAEGLIVKFRFRGHVHELPCTDPVAIEAINKRNGHPLRARRRLLIALSAPFFGHCYKTVPALLPG